MMKKTVITNWLLLCGVISSVLYFLTDVIASIIYPGYSIISQCFSELQAINAPTRTFIIVLMSGYNFLIVLFSAGVIISENKWQAKIAGLMLIGYAVSGQITTMFFPMHMRGIQPGMSDAMHAKLTIAFVVFTLLYIVFGSSFLKKRFIIYSAATIVVLVAFGMLAGMDSASLAANLPTPWLGLKERVNIYATLIWILVYSVELRRRERDKHAK